jgi:hypothetical protein
LTFTGEVDEGLGLTRGETDAVRVDDNGLGIDLEEFSDGVSLGLDKVTTVLG